MTPHVLTPRRVESVIDELERVKAKVVGRAYEIFRRRGEQLGAAIDDWLSAEREVVWRPAVEVIRTDTEVLVEVAVAGVAPDQVDLKVTPESLLVEAAVEHTHTGKPGQVVTCEFSPGRLFRLIPWPAQVDLDGVRAVYRDGMLYVRAAVAPGERVREVEVETI